MRGVLDCILRTVMNQWILFKLGGGWKGEGGGTGPWCPPLSPGSAPAGSLEQSRTLTNLIIIICFLLVGLFVFTVCCDLHIDNKIMPLKLITRVCDRATGSI